jgi:hypothetical protein
MDTTEKYQTYLFEYPYQGRQWGFELQATSPEDAEARFKALGWGRYQGRLVARVSVPGTGWLVQLRRWLGGGA